MGSKGERRAELWEAQRNAIEDEKRGLDAKIARLAQGLKVVETGGLRAVQNSPSPMQSIPASTCFRRFRNG